MTKKEIEELIEKSQIGTINVSIPGDSFKKFKNIQNSLGLKNPETVTFLIEYYWSKEVEKDV
ncbi:MAG: hypothetical protein AYK18_06985 [Theionarchaea archaeon DG-70]|nr:MAG: hypothetical protein AYK18_06985 [Theionarchaea archaeon DG-70]